ncbi:unnamed protein product [Protopolystoma xenopodis]|uniref:Uncharacterized protein n=1 Tax=Protopolystoma xenopodis TaxID=117903 RepID=A0A448X840_9PLAT|nr:unnamed protein product [Protopolystoma xenopodis]
MFLSNINLLTKSNGSGTSTTSGCVSQASSIGGSCTGLAGNGYYGNSSGAQSNGLLGPGDLGVGLTVPLASGLDGLPGGICRLPTGSTGYCTSLSGPQGHPYAGFLQTHPPPPPATTTPSISYYALAAPASASGPHAASAPQPLSSVSGVGPAGSPGASYLSASAPPTSLYPGLGPPVTYCVTQSGPALGQTICSAAAGLTGPPVTLSGHAEAALSNGVACHALSSASAASSMAQALALNNFLAAAAAAAAAATPSSGMHAQALSGQPMHQSSPGSVSPTKWCDIWGLPNRLNWLARPGTNFYGGSLR